MKLLTVTSALTVGLALTSCAATKTMAEPGASPSASPAASPPPVASSSPSLAKKAAVPALTGFGATLAQWNAAHTLDVSVPARNAYLPRVAGDPNGEDTWQLVAVAAGRINSYTLNVLPSSLGSAEGRARQELPPDTRILWARTVAGNCAQEQFESATLAAALGDGQVNVEFDNATSGNATPVTEELFGTYNAQTVAEAPAC